MHYKYFSEIYARTVFTRRGTFLQLRTALSDRLETRACVALVHFVINEKY